MKFVVSTMAKAYANYERLMITAAAPNVLHCELHRPTKLNAFDPLMWDEIRLFFAAVEHDAACRAVLVSGSGRAFTCGLDLMASSIGNSPLAPGDGSIDSARRG